MLVKKISFSLLGLGVTGVTGGAIYYITNKTNENKPEEKQEKKFSGSLVFTKQDKKSDSSKKIYQENLSSDQVSDLADKKCKFENENGTLTCKISNLPVEEEKAYQYVTKLNTELQNMEESEDKKLPEELKKKIQEKETEFKENFPSEIYESIQEEIKITT